MAKVNVYIELRMEIHHHCRRVAKLNNFCDGISIDSGIEEGGIGNQSNWFTSYKESKSICLAKNVSFKDYSHCRINAEDFVDYNRIMKEWEEDCKQFFRKYVKHPEAYTTPTNMNTIKAFREEFKALDDKKYLPYDESFDCVFDDPHFTFEFCKPEKKVTKKRKAVKK